ncbi:hypothetical protein [Pseudomonas sp. NA-150]|uniref:hypothetical protein n=1 Tax=Pseudomonas sp. NA-150 TaxID=3367525 RepID=UPI0037C6405B
MKRTALTGLFLTAALLASPVFAADDLCTSNLQTIKDEIAGGDQADETTMELKETQKAAMAAHAKGDDKKCIELTSKALQDVDKEDSGGDSDGGSK